MQALSSEPVATPQDMLIPDGAEYVAATERVGEIDRSERGKLAVSGLDRAAFLDSVLSNDIAGIAVGAGADATLLTPKGRMLAEVRVLRTDDELALDTERVCLQALFEALMAFRIGYQVELHKRTLECGLTSLVGPGSDRLMAPAPPAGEHAHVASAVGDAQVRAIRTRLGIDLRYAAGEHQRVRAALQAAGAVPIGAATFECVRIEHGIARFGAELDKTTMPQEAGIHERAVSYTKGCYIGQETVARLYWKGKPNRHLRGLLLTGPAPAGAKLRQGEVEVGVLPAVAISPRLGVVALALVRREVEPGAVLAVGGTQASATVVELPFAAVDGAR